MYTFILICQLQEAAEEGKCDQQSTHSVADDNEVDTQTHADDNSPHCVAPVVVSSNSSCCRICQDTDETTGRDDNKTPLFLFPCFLVSRVVPSK